MFKLNSVENSYKSAMATQAWYNKGNADYDRKPTATGCIELEVSYVTKRKKRQQIEMLVVNGEYFQVKYCKKQMLNAWLKSGYEIDEAAREAIEKRLKEIEEWQLSLAK